MLRPCVAVDTSLSASEGPAHCFAGASGLCPRLQSTANRSSGAERASEGHSSLARSAQSFVVAIEVFQLVVGNTHDAEIAGTVPAVE